MISKVHCRGTHRAITPRETMARVRPMLSKFGITLIDEVTRWDRVGVPVVMIVRPEGRSLGAAQGKGLNLEAAVASDRKFGITLIDEVTRWDRVGVPVVMIVRPEGRSLGAAQGKGLNLEAAVASGVMEAAEGWHAERDALPVRVASVVELFTRGNVIDVRRLPRRRDSRLRDGLSIPWVEGVDLLRDSEPIWVPYALVHTDYSAPPQAGAGCFCASSNGLAAGNTADEALVHALAEVIERDALAIWHARGAAAKHETRVDSGTIDDPDCLDLLERFEAADMAVGIWDATSDVGVATMHAEIVERGERQPPFFPQAISGDGCHPSRNIALTRALTEAAQSRLTT